MANDFEECRDSDSQKQWLKERLSECADSDLLEMCKRYFYEDGSFDFVDVFDADSIDEFFSTPYDAIRAMFYGNVETLNELLKLNAYGNLESVYEYQLEEEAANSVDELADIIWDDPRVVEDMLEDDILEAIEYWNSLDE